MAVAKCLTFTSMIAYLKGKFVSKNPSAVIVDIGGIGYEVNISLNTYTAIQQQEEGLLFTHLLIKEDAHSLYGFADAKEKDIFLLLLSVSGIGAGTARLMLSYMKPDEIAAAVVQGDSKSLERIKGIGKKTAERAVLELKDKMGKSVTGITISVEKEGTAQIQQDALEALTALGIQRAQAQQALYKVLQSEPHLPLEDVIKKVLKGL